MSNHGGALWERWIVKMEQTRDLYAKFIHANREEVGFTHSTSEGMNIIAHMLTSKGSVISNELEFPTSNLPWLNKGADVTIIRAKQGKILKNDIVNAIKEKTKTIVISHVQYSTGFRQDLKESVRSRQKRFVFSSKSNPVTWSHVNFNIQDFDIDFMASNGHNGFSHLLVLVLSM